MLIVNLKINENKEVLGLRELEQKTKMMKMSSGLFKEYDSKDAESIYKR